MVEAQYVIVPNDDQEVLEHGKRSNQVVMYLKEGYRIVNKMANRDAVHWVLIKFPPKEGDRLNRETPTGDPIVDTFAATEEE